MSCIVYQVDKKTGVKYAYESVSYWDKEKQQPRSKRTYIGKVDPDTGEIIPKDKKETHSDNKKDNGSAELKRLYEEIKIRDNQISELKGELKTEQTRIAVLEETIRKIKSLSEVAIANV